MLSYQHIYHAGNWADIHKHTILSLLWRKLLDAGGDWHYIDSHAGRGLYDLTSDEAQKTAEFKQGFERFKLIRHKEIFKDFHAAMQRYNPRYPGSVACVETQISLQAGAHKMSLCELNPRELGHLRKNFSGKPAISIYFEDGHKKSVSLAMSSKARPFIFMDPSYEIKSEYEKTVQTIQEIKQNRPDAVIMLWHCILKGQNYHQMIEQPLASYPMSRLQNTAEIDRGMIGSVITLINAPSGFDRDMAANVAELQGIF